MECGGDIGIGHQEADRLVVPLTGIFDFHHDLDEFRVGKPEQLTCQRVHVIIGQRGVARGAAQGVVVEFLQLRDEGAQVGAFGIARDAQSAAGGDALRQFVDARRELDVRAEVAGDRFARFDKSLRFDQWDVIGGVVRQAKGGAMLEAFDQQAESVERGESLRAEDFRQAASARPSEGRVEEDGRGGEIVFALEEIKERGGLAVVVVVAAII